VEAKSEKLTTWQKLGYGLGDIYGGGSGVVISFYYLIFLTDVVRISPAAHTCWRAFRWCFCLSLHCSTLTVWNQSRRVLFP
jgi:Na+/melibiose symporter-like transporter